MNISCDDFQVLIAENPADAWSAVDGDATLQTFNQMYAEDQLVCQECYGISDPTKCNSNDPTCHNGLQKLNGTITRQDTAASIFSQMGADFACILDPGSGCSAYPQCLDEHGPAGFAIITSLVSMHNSLENVYDAIEAARSSATDQMGLFSQVFAPVPSLKNKSIWMEIMFVIAGLVAGIVPGLGETVTPVLLGTATAGGLLTGVGSAVVMDNMIFDQPSAADTASHLDTITNNIRGAYSDVATSLFQNGSYDMPIGDGQGTKMQTWADIMAGGALLQQDVNATDELQLVYERVLYQQLVVYTWQNLEVGDVGHLPFIAFENATCDQVDSSRGSLDTIIAGVSQSDTNMTYNGSCYYLLDGTTSKVRSGNGENVCTGKPLPGGTNENMIKNTAQFANLTLADFVIPSVKGWQNNSYQNGYESLKMKGSIFTDPQAAGVVNLPICDYIGSPNSPGIGCPKIQNTMPTVSKSCETYPASMGINQPGQFVDGSCGIHIKQWQKTEGDENPLGRYQLSVTVLDGAGRAVGEATKQSAAETLEVVDSALPYDLFVATGDVDSAPILFWYSDQYWNSSSTGTGNNTNHCAVGGYESGVRQMDCGFSCPFPDPSEDPPVSATIDNPFPNTPIPAVGGDITFSNLFTISRLAAPTASVEPYSTGRCGVEIRQYQKNEGNSSMNNTPNYKIEVTLKGGDMRPIGGPEALQPAPSGQPISVFGLASPFIVTAGGLDSDPLTMSFAGKTWQTNSPGRTCQVGSFKDGYRDLDCRFDC